MKINIGVRITIGAVLVATLIWVLPWHDVSAAIRRLSLPLWLGALAGFLAGHRLGAVKWRRLVNAGRAGLGSRDSVRCYAAGLFANLCLPSVIGGDVLRAALAARATGRVEATVLGSIADRLIDLLASGGIIIGAATFAHAAFPGWGSTALKVGIALALLVGLALTPLLVRMPLKRWPRRVRRRIGRSLVALRYVARDTRTAVFAVAISICVQTIFILLNVWIGVSIGIDIPLAAWFFAWPLAKFAATIPISPGGLGVRDAAFGALLVPLGVPLAVGVVASLIWQSVLIGGGLLAGLYWWLNSRKLGLGWPDTAQLAVANPSRNHG